MDKPKLVFKKFVNCGSGIRVYFQDETTFFVPFENLEVNIFSVRSNMRHFRDYMNIGR